MPAVACVICCIQVSGLSFVARRTYLAMDDWSDQPAVSLIPEVNMGAQWLRDAQGRPAGSSVGRTEQWTSAVGDKAMFLVEKSDQHRSTNTVAVVA
ncbi:MAG TPA: hypothetical protein VIO37_08455 [Candidatus Dormibacteraeota bacterium]